jgi:hypothetical protein
VFSQNIYSWNSTNFCVLKEHLFQTKFINPNLFSQAKHIYIWTSEDHINNHLKSNIPEASRSYPWQCSPQTPLTGNNCSSPADARRQKKGKSCNQRLLDSIADICVLLCCPFLLRRAHLIPCVKLYTNYERVMVRNYIRTLFLFLHLGMEL